MKVYQKMLYWFLGALAVIGIVIIGFGYYFSSPGYSGPVSNHFNGTKFINENGARAKNFLEIIKWAVNRNEGEWEEIDQHDFNYGNQPTERVTDSLVITFVNHATFLIQVNGLNILTDPIWSDRASPFSFVGPKRMRPPGIKYEDLPEIDIVLISHNHYDHLDLPTVKKLNQQFKPIFVAPLGVGKFLSNQGINKTEELDWWEETSISALDFTAVPAQHFSSRGLFDKDKTLWAGFVIKSAFGNVYFAGDTGYGDFFKEIGNRFSIDVGLIPIGAYEPRWVMSDIHLNPAEAIKAHKDVGAQTSISMHYGIFPLADDGQYESVDELTQALELPENISVDFQVLAEGEKFILKK